jgi:hypothetical protein
MCGARYLCLERLPGVADTAIRGLPETLGLQGHAAYAGAALITIDAAALWDASLAALKRDPLFFAERESVF